MIRKRRPSQPRRCPLASNAGASSGWSNRSIRDPSTLPADVRAVTARSASATLSNTASNRPTAEPIIRFGRRSTRPVISGLVDEWADLADQPLEGLGVVRRRLLGDHGVEPELEVRRKPLGELLGRAVPERRVALDVGERRLVVLHRCLPDAVGLRLRVADRRLDPERELDLRRIPPDGLAVVAEDLDLVAHEVDGTHAVPHVGVLRDGSERLLL